MGEVESWRKGRKNMKEKGYHVITQVVAVCVI